jgi:hypothetical protein
MDMEIITLYKFQDKSFDIVPDEHVVSDMSRLTKTALPESLKNFGIVFAVSIVTTLFIVAASQVMERTISEPGLKKIIGTVMAACVIGLLIYCGVKIKIVIGSLFKPNLKTPESAVRSFLSSLQKGLYKQAYNLLSDTAQKLGKLEMPKNNIMQKKMPDLNFDDLHTFASFWQRIEFPWKQSDLERPKAQTINDSVAIVELRIDMDRTSIRWEEFPLSAKFVTVKRGGLWIIANGFFWPQDV